MAISGLIFDRTQADVNRLLALARRIDSAGWDSLTPEEKTEWRAAQKGAYNEADLNRVGSAVSYLAMLYRQMPGVLKRRREALQVADDALFRVPFTEADVNVQVITNWRLGVHVWESQAAQYLQNLVTLRGLLPVPEGTPEVPPDLVGLTFQEANDIERMLDMLDDEFRRKNREMLEWIGNTAEAWTYCAEPCCGED